MISEEIPTLKIVCSPHTVFMIRPNNNVNSLSQCKLAEKYYISLGSVSTILKRNTEYLNDYETNQNQNVKRKLKDTAAQKLYE
ncbi:unnamed protein product [Rotaria sordida]|uniref:HTH psq-type domain-containing protein n=1 Tax=Rotaria sordida TaxID=392033 RepID=A0A819EYV5_9BILA|nr:unnamed protein product [Rotaria sordida]CAF3859002.1 unnamed protein product [Rotaria sordida]